jgi:hypothetical protein
MLRGELAICGLADFRARCFVLAFLFIGAVRCFAFFLYGGFLGRFVLFRCKSDSAWDEHEHKHACYYFFHFYNNLIKRICTVIYTAIDSGGCQQSARKPDSIFSDGE